MDRQKSATRTGYLFALAATVLWSGNIIAARGLADSIPPAMLGLLRWVVAVVALAPFGLHSLRMDKQLLKQHFGFLCLIALIGVTVPTTVLYIAARTSEAMNISLISLSSPVFTIVVARFLLKEPFTLRRTAGLLITVTGIVMLITAGDISQLMHLTLTAGDMWMVFQSMTFAVYSVLLRLRPKEIHQSAFLTFTFFLGVCFLIPWAGWEMSRVESISFSLSTAATILYLGIGASLGAFFCWNRAVMIIGPVRTGFVYYCMPLFSGVEAFLLLGEPLHLFHLYSGVIILLGVTIATRE